MTEDESRRDDFSDAVKEKMAISIEEPSKQVKHVMTAKEIQDKARFTFSSAPKFDHISSGLLELKINSWCSGIQLRVRDGIHKRIDGSMNQFMISLLQCAEQIRDN